MKTKNTRIISAVLSAALLLGSCALSSCGKKIKNYDEKKKSSEAAVEDYFIYLSKGKYDKLSRYTDKEYDPFQNLDGLVDPSQLELWNAYLSKIKYEITDFFIVEDMDDATDVDVQLKIIDAKKLLSKNSSFGSISEICDAVSDCDTYKKVDTTIELTCIKDGKRCTIDNTQVLFDKIKSEVDLLAAAAPDKSSSFENCLNEFMQKLVAMDMKYLNSRDFSTGMYDLEDYDQFFHGFYQTMASYITYQIELTSISDTDAGFVIHISKKDEDQAFKDFFDDPVNVSPLLEDMLNIIVYTDPSMTDLDNMDLLQFDKLLPGFKNVLESENTITLDVKGVIKLGDSYEHGYRLDGDFSEVFPLADIEEYLDDKDDEYGYAAYRAAIQTLHDDGRITDKDYERLMRTFGEATHDLDHLDQVMIAHGYTADLKKNGLSDSVKYTKDKIRVEVITGSDYDPTSCLYEGMDMMEDLYDEIEDESLEGDVTGGGVFAEFRGQYLDDAEPVEVYYVHSAAREYIIAFMAEDVKDKDIEDIQAILQELNLD